METLITGEKKEFWGWCVVLNKKGRCLGFKEVEKQWENEDEFCGEWAAVRLNLVKALLELKDETKEEQNEGD